MIVVIILFAMFAPVVSARAYDQVILEHNSLSPRIPVLENFGIFNGVKDGVDVYAQRGIPDDVYYYFGTDSLGRDLWTRLWSGTRLSLLIAVIAVVIDLAIGMSYGLISGYFGKKVDFLMQRFVEILNGIPQVVHAVCACIGTWNCIDYPGASCKRLDSHEPGCKGADAEAEKPGICTGFPHPGNQ